jgi:TPR repeat protein
VIIPTDANFVILVFTDGEDFKMKHMIIVSLYLLAFSVPSAVFSADFDKGLKAARMGDYAAALKEWTPLAEKGHSGAQSNLGVFYDRGQGVKRDFEKAIKWYTLAAKQGDAAAQFNLGLMFENGRGVPADNVVAVNWYRSAAEQGHVHAQSNLGFMYVKGKGIEKNLVLAHKWWNIATFLGDPNARRNLHKLAQMLTAEQRGEANRLALEWLKENGKEPT